MVELPRPLPPPTWRDRVGELASWRERASTGPVALLVVAVVVAVVSVAGVLAFAGRLPTRGGGPDVALSLPRADAAGSGASGPAAPSTTVGGDLRVHAAGAVVAPGVVTVPAGSRVADVVTAAGGAAPDADLDQVNLAALVSDGERVYIPRRGETAIAAVAGASAGAKAGELVNINQADEATLETLPGVGPATARAIIDYRNEHGRFKSVDELLNVRGIGPSKLSQIKPHARV